MPKRWEANELRTTLQVAGARPDQDKLADTANHAGDIDVAGRKEMNVLRTKEMRHSVQMRAAIDKS